MADKISSSSSSAASSPSASAQSRRDGFRFLWSLIAFFIVFASVDAYYVYTAVSTHTGVIDDRAYEDGLAYDAFAEKARAQDSLGVRLDPRFENNSLIVTFTDKAGRPIENARISAALVRRIQGGSDFEVSLGYRGDGVYSAPLDLPFHGRWTANLEATWTEQDTTSPLEYQTAMNFLSR